MKWIRQWRVLEICLWVLNRSMKNCSITSLHRVLADSISDLEERWCEAPHTKLLRGAPDLAPSKGLSIYQPEDSLVHQTNSAAINHEIFRTRKRSQEKYQLWTCSSPNKIFSKATRLRIV